MLDALLFDLMGTVIYDPYREALEAATGMELTSVFAARDRNCWPEFELGAIDETEFVRRFFPEPPPGRQFDLEGFNRVRRERYHMLPGMAEVLADLQGRIDCYVASNYPVWIDEMREDFAFDKLFRKVYASCHLGLRKPDPAFFVAILDDLGRPPQRCLFIDDRADNCEAAAGVGLRVHLFDGAQRLRERLRAEGVLSS